MATLCPTIFILVLIPARPHRECESTAQSLEGSSASDNLVTQGWP